MRIHLKRYYGTRALHFLTFSCYRRLPFLSAPSVRDSVLRVLEETRQKYGFVIVGYVIMPEHVHLLMNEPQIGNPSVAMQVFKQRTSRLIRHEAPRFWQLRFYDFNVFSEKKYREKLDYMHWNPVKRGLVNAPEQWRWSSYSYYQLSEVGVVRVNEGWKPIRPLTVVETPTTGPFAGAKEPGTPKLTYRPEKRQTFPT